ncbi:MAG: aspartate aminotransferase family protein [Rhodospirillaceae bacterium]|nr:aspartate aminotransferase family protein [Rhodospirillaceae bacterium]
MSVMREGSPSMAPAGRDIPVERIPAFMERECARFVERNPASRALAERAGRNWLHGVPMFWMKDWGTPFPLFIREARGVTLTDVDGNAYIDFCLGDTGAMFGHAPEPVTRALRAQSERGLTTMLPAEDAVLVGELLTQRFGLPRWQITATASDANRSVIRWARAATRRDKILVFNGCYHGAVDDTFVVLENGRPRNRPGLAGEVRDLTATTKVIEWNDAEALARALSPGDVALVLAEPVMTNCGMVMPLAGYHETLRSLTRQHGTLLAIDETHTISTGPGGCTRTYGLDPDFFVLGKPVAGGIPAAVYGFTDAVERAMQGAMGDRASVFNGIGTTLSGNALQLAAMRAVLEEVLTDEVYVRAMPLAERLERGIARVIAQHGLPWHAARLGLRVEFVCWPDPPRNGTESALAAKHDVERALVLFCLNRGVVITPYYNMMLVCPATRDVHVDRLVRVLDEGLAALTGRENDMQVGN